MTEAAFDWPTLQEELDRKVMDTLSWLVCGVQDGRLTKEQASAGLDALFMAVSGLVDRDFINIITGAQRFVSDAKSVVKKHFHAPAGDETISFIWNPGDDIVTTCKRICGMATGGTVKSFEHAKEAAEFMERISAQMEQRGWIEL